MSDKAQYKKMENVRKLGFWARCDCGHEHKFKSSDVDTNLSDKTTIIFKNIYSCSKCGTEYNGIIENANARRFSPIGMSVFILIVFGLLFGGYKLVSHITSPPTYHDLNHATKKEINNFYKWDEKQQQQKLDNQPAFNNGD